MIAIPTFLAAAAIVLGLILLAFGLLAWLAAGMKPIPSSSEGAHGCIIALIGLIGVIAGIVQVWT